MRWRVPGSKRRELRRDKRWLRSGHAGNRTAARRPSHGGRMAVGSLLSGRARVSRDGTTGREGSVGSVDANGDANGLRVCGSLTRPPFASTFSLTGFPTAGVKLQPSFGPGGARTMQGVTFECKDTVNQRRYARKSRCTSTGGDTDHAFRLTRTRTRTLQSPRSYNPVIYKCSLRQVAAPAAEEA